MVLDWESSEMHVLGDETPPLPLISAHIWLCTSGTTKKKWVALSKNAFLASAEAVNQHHGLTINDRWLQPLPNHHVGGLSIWARAHLTGSKVIDYPDVTRKKWDVHHFYQTLIAERITITSVVPTQLYDLVHAELKAPKSLRAVIVGGGYLSQSLYQKAKALGWPAVPTYGCTECCSQIATGTVQDPKMKILPHLEVEMRDTLHVRGVSVFTAIFDGELRDPKVDGWYNTGDAAELEGGVIIPKGRFDDQIKIGGEKVLLGPLKQVVEDIAGGSGVTLRVDNDERLGSVLVLVAENKDHGEAVFSAYNAQVPGYARARAIEYVEKIDRNSMGKII